MAPRGTDEYLDAPPDTSEERPAELADRPLRGLFRRPRARHRARRARPTRGGCDHAGPDGTSALADEDIGAAHERGVRLPRLPHPVETQGRNREVVRLHLHRRPAYQGVEGEVTCPDPHDVPGRSG